MKKSNWSEYGKYLVLSDNSGTKLKGNFTTFQNFKKVKSIIDKISHSDKTMHLYNNEIYEFKVKSSEAKIIIENIKKCKWDKQTEKILLIANQLIFKL